MDVVRCYRILLGFYPSDFHRRFSGEMLHVFEQRAGECFALGKAASVAFVFREFVSVLTGAQTMWMAKIFSAAKPLLRCNAVSDHARQRAGLRLFSRPAERHPPADTTPETDLGVTDIQKLRETAVNNMVRAIAGHDFSGARRYSDEESRLQGLLRAMNEPPKPQRAESA